MSNTQVRITATLTWTRNVEKETDPMALGGGIGHQLSIAETRIREMIEQNKDLDFLFDGYKVVAELEVTG